MDLSKAFDCLPHGLIISKLHAYGVSTPACELLFSYLHGRKQRVKISTSRSSWTTLSKGIPQGSILGPLLFDIFVNDLTLFIEKCKLYNYADDNSLDSSSDDLLDALRNLKRDGRNAIYWFTKNGMQANPDKFNFMLLSPSPVEKQVLELCDGITLISVAVVNVLGVTADDNLSFNEHISVCCTKAARQLNALASSENHLQLLDWTSLLLSLLTKYNRCNTCMKKKTSCKIKIDKRVSKFG